MNIAICGFGRAGKACAEKLLKSDEHKLLGVICRVGSTNSGMDVGTILYGSSFELGVGVVPIDKAFEVLNDKNVDVVIDFSNRVMAMPLIDLCGKLKSKLVICTTDHSVEEISKFEELSHENNIGVVYAPNLTLGINMLISFSKKLSLMLPNFDFEIIECHPKRKTIPTSTSRIISQNINREQIPIHSVRMDGFVGVHKVIATDGDEKVVIEHESFGRGAFANGAIIAAKFIEKRSGFHLMKDVMNAIEDKSL